MLIKTLKRVSNKMDFGYFKIKHKLVKGMKHLAEKTKQKSKKVICFCMV